MGLLVWWRPRCGLAPTNPHSYPPGVANWAKDVSVVYYADDLPQPLIFVSVFLLLALIPWGCRMGSEMDC